MTPAPSPAMPPGVPRAFAHDAENFWLDGRPFPIRCGELHFARIPRPYWRDRLKKARAMGLNAVCCYLFWNAHEPRPGVYDFADDRDAAAFVRMAAEEGLYVLLRPGPYVCAEWDAGGLPPWLFADPGLTAVRCSDPRYLDPALRWLTRVGEELSGLTVTRGGPILMVQAENEYGAFGNDRAYMEAVRATLAGPAGFGDVPLFTCDWPAAAFLDPGRAEGCMAVANFGSEAEKKIGDLRRLRPDQPPMCGEFWCGWFDQWGKPRAGTDDPSGAAADLRWMAENGASFSIYMFHGGTSFGFSAGANHYDGVYSPTVTSYDYRACLDEAGRPTAKFRAFRDVLAPHTGEPLPDVPPPAPAPMSVAPFTPTEVAPLLANLPDPVRAAVPRPMEEYGLAYGVMVYRADLSDVRPGDMGLVGVHDFARVFVDGAFVGEIDRRADPRGAGKVRIDPAPPADGGARPTLEIVVDALGRVNFGPEMPDRKGITGRVSCGHLTLFGWDVFPVPLDDPAYLAALRFVPAAEGSGDGPAFYRASFDLPAGADGGQIADTFLDLRAWGRGCVWVNGRNLGRFWSVGPQRTLFCPGCWLRPGRNEVLVFDALGGGPRPLAGLAEPILDDVPGAAAAE